MSLVIERPRVTAIPQEQRRKLPSWLIPSIIALLAVAVRLAVGPQPLDDAFITFRYSRNLADGLGFVYNPGTHVLGTTTPLWTLLMAFAYWVGLHDLPRIALVVSSLADAGIAVLVACAPASFGIARPWRLLAGLAVAVVPMLIRSATSGMETELFALFIVAACLAQVDNRPTLAAACAALATLTRPEGLILFGLLGASYLLTRRLPSVRTLAVAAVPLLAWVAFAVIYFGSPVPESILAKSAVYHLPSLPNLLGTLWLMDLSPLTAAVVLFVALMLLARPVWQRPELFPLAAMGPALALFYCVAAFHGALMAPWYVPPILPFAVIGLAAVVSAKGTRRLLIALLALLFVMTDGGAQLLALRYPENARMVAYRHAVDLLNLPPDAVIAAPEIGAIGDEADSRILDAVGLVSPEAVPYHRPGAWTVPPDLIRERRPDAIISADIFLDPAMANTPWFRASYRQVAALPLADGVLGGAHVVYVYQRIR